jgi:hypothetical protein
MMTVADSDWPAIDLDARAVCSTAGKLMTVPIITSPALTAGRRNLAPAPI